MTLPSVQNEKELILQGDRCWKLQDWKGCIDSYEKAIQLNPHSTALTKLEMVERIINYRCTELINF